MELNYDRTADALYVTIQNAPASRTRELDSGTLVDLGADGSVVGIEVLNPARAWLPLVLESYALSPSDVKRLAEVQAYGIYQATGADRGPEARSTSMNRTLVDA